MKQQADYSIYPTLLDAFFWAKKLGKWQELIDKINRVKVETQYPAWVAKGQEFEKLINAKLSGVQITLENNLFMYHDYGFHAPLVERIVKKLWNNQGTQKYIQGFIDTGCGSCKLYGFVDYVYPEVHVDLKTCGEYVPGKYAINAQHKCYPLIDNKKGLTYLITDFHEMYVEHYDFTPEIKDRFIFEVTEFIEWLEENRHLITDTKIFGK